MEPWPYVTAEDTMVKIIVTEDGYDLPPAVMMEIFESLKAMCQPQPETIIPDRFTDDGLWLKAFKVHAVNQTCGDIAGGFECATITVGFSPEEQQDLIQWHDATHWPNVQGGTPVAHWRSGISTGCDMYIYHMPDGHFEWTEP